MKYIILSTLFLFVACSKEDKLKECGLVGEWLCCTSASDCIIYWQGQPISEKWTFEEDGEYFIDAFIPQNGTWNTDDDCTELVFQPGTPDEGRIKMGINGDELVLHYGSVVGDRTFCRQ